VYQAQLGVNPGRSFSVNTSRKRNCRGGWFNQNVEVGAGAQSEFHKRALDIPYGIEYGIWNE